MYLGVGRRLGDAETDAAYGNGQERTELGQRNSAFDLGAAGGLTRFANLSERRCRHVCLWQSDKAIAGQQVPPFGRQAHDSRVVKVTADDAVTPAHGAAMIARLFVEHFHVFGVVAVEVEGQHEITGRDEDSG